MGIKGLLPFVQKAIRKIDITEYESQRVAIDVSCFLYRGFSSCAQEVAQGSRAAGYIIFLKRYIDLLSRNKNHIILVFDGSKAPAKREVNANREKSKKKYKRYAEQALADNQSEEAYKHFQQCVEITPDIVNHVIEEFAHYPNVDILIAPYEADAQLAFLSINGIVDIIVTEDSDLIPYGCKKIAFKLTPEGSGVLYEKDNLHKCVGKNLQDRFDDVMFRRICIFSGCDYVPTGIPGVGLKTAEEAFRRCQRLEIYNDILAFIKMLPFYITTRIPKTNSTLLNACLLADMTFAHQIVFDPRIRQQVPLTPFPASIKRTHVPHKGAAEFPDDPFSFLGNIAADDVAIQSALGILELPDGMPRREVFSTNAASIYHPNFFKQELKKPVVFPVIEEAENATVQAGTFPPPPLFDSSKFRPLFQDAPGSRVTYKPLVNVHRRPPSDSPKSSAKEKRRGPFSTGSPYQSAAYKRTVAAPRSSPVAIPTPPAGIGFVTPEAVKKPIDGEKSPSRPPKNRSFPTGLSPMLIGSQEEVFPASSRSNSQSYVTSPRAFQKSYLDLP